VLQPGTDLDSFVVGDPLGRGGSATVYLAHSRGGSDGDDAQVALKVLDEEHREPPDLSRLQREFQLAGRLDHPHIVKMHGRGSYWLAMQYVDGGNAGSLHNLDNRLAALAQVAAALDYTHREGIVHCDVKPSNILVFKDFSAGGAVLIDFGVAHALAPSGGSKPDRDAQVQASLPYAAPEILLGHTPSAATDEYSLACTAVELLTGTMPFVANTAIGLAAAQLHHQPPRLSHEISWIPHAFDSILAKAMAKDPDLRYESCTEFIGLITRALR
jgi:serine/threonine protein kinase